MELLCLLQGAHTIVYDDGMIRRLLVNNLPQIISHIRVIFNDQDRGTSWRLGGWWNDLRWHDVLLPKVISGHINEYKQYYIYSTLTYVTLHW